MLRYPVAGCPKTKRFYKKIHKHIYSKSVKKYRIKHIIFVPKNDNRFSDEIFITKYLVLRDKTYFKKNIHSRIYSRKPKL